jgi:hypothetical protein
MVTVGRDPSRFSYRRSHEQIGGNTYGRYCLMTETLLQLLAEHAEADQEPRAEL